MESCSVDIRRRNQNLEKSRPISFPNFSKLAEVPIKRSKNTYSIDDMEDTIVGSVICRCDVGIVGTIVDIDSAS